MGSYDRVGMQENEKIQKSWSGHHQVAAGAALQGHKQEILSIQVLRAFAAILVVMFHVTGTADANGYEAWLFKPLAGWGACGVDLFFVISGFIMVYVQDTKRSMPFGFFMNRVLRIVPLYWILTALLVILFMLLPVVFSRMQLTPAWIVESLSFTSQLAGHPAPLLYDGWTLEYEMAFYAVFALSLYARRIGVSIVIASVVMALWALLFRQFLVMEFIYGMIIGWMFVGSRAPILKPTVVFLGGACLFLATIAFKPDESYRALVYGLPAALMVYGCVFMSQWGSGWIVKIGNASYSIYLVQVFTIAGFFKLIGKLGFPKGMGDVPVLLCVVVTAGVGYIVYVGLEKRLALLATPLKRRLMN